MESFGENKKFILDGIYFEILSDCNLRCKHCYNSSGEKYNKLDTEIIKKIIKETKDSSLRKITISGGEPLLHPEIWSILDEFCENKDLIIRIITNGTLINEDVIEKLKRYKIELQISLNGSKSEIDDLIRGENSFKNTIKGLNLLNKANQMNKVIVNFVLNKYNYMDIDETIRLLDSKGVKRINFNFLISSGRGKDNYSKLALDSKSLYNILYKLNEIKENKPNIKFKIPKLSSGCSLILKKENIPLMIRVDSEGNVFPCQIFESKKSLSIGNVYNDNVIDIINSTKINKLIDFMEYAYKYNYNCSKCIWKVICNKGCPAKLLSNGILDGDDGLCNMRKLRFRDNLVKDQF